jgi:Right handed beta helix region
MGGNTISGNGTDPQSVYRVGIRVSDAVADIVGGNTITNNASSGVLVHSARVVIGDHTFGSSVNTISQNGSQVTQANFPFANGGVFAYVDSAVDITDAIISGNTGAGVTLVFRSNATITAGQITLNTAGGVDPLTGSAAIFQLFQSSPVSVSGNSVADLRCSGTDSRYTGFGPNSLAGIGTVASTCPPANF